MKMNEPLYRVINSKTRAKLLKFLLGGRSMPDMSERELAKMVGLSNVAVNRAMHEFESINLVRLRRIGSAHVWTVNEKSHAYGALKRILDAGEGSLTEIEGLKKFIRDGLKDIPVLRAVIFGSIARGEEDDDSDIDLFILVKNGKDREEVKKRLEILGTDCVIKYGNSLGAYVLTENQFREKSRAHLVREIEKDGIIVI